MLKESLTLELLELRGYTEEEAVEEDGREGMEEVMEDESLESTREEVEEAMRNVADIISERAVEVTKEARDGRGDEETFRAACC